MSLFTRHLGFRRLVPFADGETEEAEARRIREHLSECDRCRGDLAFVLDVRRAAREIRHPAPPRGTLEEILRRRAAGERVILPTSPPPPRRGRPGLTVPILVLLGLAAVVAALFLGSGEASAGASSLHIGPERPHLGQPLEVEFRAASPLAAEERVVLRGRYRIGEVGPAPAEAWLGQPFRQELERTGNGVFTGTAWLPPRAVYAAFVVESADGARVESDAGRPWEVLIHDGEGRPTFAALEQRFRVMEALRRPDEMRAAALRMTELYPEEPGGWRSRLFVELQLAGPDESPGILEAHRARLARLEQGVSAMEDPGGDRIAALVDYAERVGEEESAGRWSKRLLSEHPEHPLAQQRRILSIVAAPRAPSGNAGESHLRALELEWDRAGAMDEGLMLTAFRLALRAGDPAAARRWADRYERFYPAGAGSIVVRLLRSPGHRALGMERARRLLGRFESPAREDRPLMLSRPEHRRSLEAERRALLAHLGEALVEEGRFRAALDTLALAAESGWDPGLFRRLAGLRIVAGDTAGGLRLFGMAAADPLAEPGLRRAAGEAVGRGIGAAEWEGLVAAGREALERRLAAGPARWPEGVEGVRVLAAGGEEVRLWPLLDGRVSLLAFWHPGAADAARWGELAPRLAAAGVRALMLWTEPPPTKATTPAGGVLPPLHDAGREASDAFHAWMRPSYVVLDAEGLIRFAGRKLDDAFRHAVALAAVPAGP